MTLEEMMTTIIVDPKYMVSVEKMYQKLLFFSNISSYPEHIDGISIEERYLYKLDDTTELSFCSPDQIILVTDLNKSSGSCATGIDFETALELLEPHMRKLKIKKLKTKLI